MEENKGQTENIKTIDEAINETEQAIVKVLEDSQLNITILELIVRNIHLQLQNLSLNAIQQNKE